MVVSAREAALNFSETADLLEFLYITHLEFTEQNAKKKISSGERWGCGGIPCSFQKSEKNGQTGLK